MAKITERVKDIKEYSGGRFIGLAAVPEVDEVAWYLDHNQGKWVEARVRGYQKKDGNSIACVELENGDGKWGYIEQIAIKVDEFPPVKRGW